MYIRGQDKATTETYNFYWDVVEVQIFTLKHVEKKYTVDDYSGSLVRISSGSDCVRHINVLGYSFAETIQSFLLSFRLRWDDITADKQVG